MVLSSGEYLPNAASLFPNPGCLNANRPGTFISPQSVYPAPTNACLVASNALNGMTISMSSTGFAGRPGIDVDPTCVMDVYGIPPRILESDDLASSNTRGQFRSYGATWTRILD